MKSILIVVNTKTNNFNNITNELLDSINNYDEINYSIIKTKTINDLLKDNLFENINGILVIGGDGTISSLLQILKNKNLNIPIGCLPSGSGNGLINSLNNKDIKNVMKKILKLEERKMDSMTVKFIKNNDKFKSFLFLSYGMFSNIDVGTDNMRCLGNIRFTIGAIMELLLKKTFYAKFEYFKFNRWIKVEGNFVYFMASNLSHTSESTITSPLSKPNDNLIYLCYIKEDVSRYELFQILNSLSDGSFLKYPSVKYLSTREFKFYTNDGILDIDGEYFDAQPIHVTINPNSLSTYN
jgi:sphingosine kinase